MSRHMLTVVPITTSGRSPSDKRIVKEESSEKEVWWGPVNKPMSTDVSTPNSFILRFDARPCSMPRAGREGEAKAGQACTSRMRIAELLR